MIKIIRWGLFLLLSFSSPVFAKLKVVASFSILADFAQVIAGPHIELTTIVPLTSDPHVYQPTPEVVQRLAEADIVILNGLGFEGWIARLLKAANYSKTVVIATQDVKPRLLFEPLLKDSPAVSDPHAWHDVQAALHYVHTIAQAFIQLDPLHAAEYQQNEDQYSQQLQKLHHWIENQFAAIPLAQRKIISAHDAFGYYAARYGLTIYALQGLSTENEPSAKQIADLIQLIRREKIVSLFVENMANQHLLYQIAQETGITIGGILYADSLSALDGPAKSYLDMMKYNTNIIVTSLKSSL